MPSGSNRVAKRQFVARAIDCVLALAALAMLAPLMLVVGFIVWAGDGGSPLYGHRRYGKGGRTFLCFKFRSMALDSDARLGRLLMVDPEAWAEWVKDHKLRRDPRVTAFGRIIRKLSLDELPQLLNVLRGEMSMVGPRPIVAAEVSRYGRRFQDYCSVRPGITGVWQISGRNETRYSRRVAMDTMMVRHMSPALYWRVLFGTVRVLIHRQGAY